MDSSPTCMNFNSIKVQACFLKSHDSSNQMAKWMTYDILICLKFNQVCPLILASPSVPRGALWLEKKIDMAVLTCNKVWLARGVSVAVLMMWWRLTGQRQWHGKQVDDVDWHIIWITSARWCGTSRVHHMAGTYNNFLLVKNFKMGDTWHPSQAAMWHDDVMLTSSSEQPSTPRDRVTWHGNIAK